VAATPGQTLSHYRLVEKIGEGGMGVVWKADDTVLGRQVAIKVLPDNLAHDAERLARFRQEARLLASLNHPNIAAIHGLEESDGVRYLVLELAPGQTLAERIARGPLPVDEALTVCKQIAEALEAAHETGIIHRDLKPANVKVTPNGKVKVLDFGLAKAFEAGHASGPIDTSLSPTVTTAGTMAGVILGTAAYMSPEQARGKPVDKRTDIWSFGCVLYECLTGRMTFQGETVTDVLSAVLRAEPDWTKLPGKMSGMVRWLLERCLRKDPDRRLHDAGDARVLLQEALEGATDESIGDAMPFTSPPRFRRALPWGLAAAMAVIAAIVLWTGGRAPDPGPGFPMRLSVPLPEGSRLDRSIDRPLLALSPDGRSVAYIAVQVGEPSIFVRRLDRPEATPLAGTNRADTPFFSPDGQWLGFFAEGKLKKVSLRGGQPISLADAGASRGACWSEDGAIVYAPATNSGLMRVPVGGGQPEALTILDEARKERTHRWPECLPGGRAVLFTVGTLDKPGDYDDSEIDVFFPDTGERRVLLRGASMARFAAPGHLVLARRGVLSTVPFDADRIAVEGTPRTLLKQVAGESSSGVAYFGVSHTGTLAFVEHDPGVTEYRLAWVDRQGETEPLSLPPREYHSPRISPDGTRVTLAIGPGAGGESDVWVLDLEADTLKRLTFDNTSWAPVWSPDGTRIAFATVDADSSLMSWKRADGSGVAESLLRGAQIISIPAGFTADTSLLLYAQTGDLTSSVFWTLPMNDQRQPQAIASSSALESDPTLSSDGRWLAYTSDETGQREVYVQAFPGPGGRWQVSEDRGADPRWSHDGTELFYLRNDRTFFVVPVRPDPTFSPDKPRELFTTAVAPSRQYTSNYDVSADGKRFLIVQPTRPDTLFQRVNIILDWPAELKRLVPTE
jgi:serine/threonine-protein kinase